MIVKTSMNAALTAAYNIDPCRLWDWFGALFDRMPIAIQSRFVLDSCTDVAAFTVVCMASHRSRSVGMVGLVAVAVVAVVAGGSAGLWLGLSRTPDGLAAPPSADSIEVRTEPFADTHQVTLDLSTKPGLALVSHASGVITSSSCEPGGSIESGAVPWSVDGAHVLALATASPIYRDLTSGTTGPDVTALQQELTRLGADLHASGTFDDETAAAIRDLLSRNHNDSGDTSGLPLSAVTWLPATTVAISSCDAVLGGPVADGSPLAMTSPTVTGAAVTPMPASMVPGDRTITVGDATIPIGDDGAIASGKALDDLLNSAVGRLAVATLGSDHPVPLQGALALADPIQAATVPATAITSGADATCVVDDGGAIHVVSVVDSSLGRSVIRFSGAAPDRVQVAPSGVTCG